MRQDKAGTEPATPQTLPEPLLPKQVSKSSAVCFPQNCALLLSGLCALTYTEEGLILIHLSMTGQSSSMEFSCVRFSKRWKVNAYVFLNSNNFWMETDSNPLGALNVKTAKKKEVWNSKNAVKNCYWSPEWLFQNLSHWSYKRKISHVRRSSMSIQLYFRILVLPELLCSIGSSI